MSHAAAPLFAFEEQLAVRPMLRVPLIQLGAAFLPVNTDLFRMEKPSSQHFLCHRSLEIAEVVAMKLLELHLQDLNPLAPLLCGIPERSASRQ